MAVIHTAYATMKMPGPKGVITIKADQRDALACENTSLLKAELFSDKAAQDQVAKVAKTEGNAPPPPQDIDAKATDQWYLVSIDSAEGDLRCLNLHPVACRSKGRQQEKGTTIEEDNKEVLANRNDANKKLKINSKLNPK
jgi:hypothetical protein